MKSRKASMKIKRKAYNEYVLLPVMVYGSETYAPNKAHMELLSVALRQNGAHHTRHYLRDHKRNTWIRHHTGVN